MSGVLAYLFVCHDLALIEVIADRVMVMKSGAVVETELHPDAAGRHTRTDPTIGTRGLTRCSAKGFEIHLFRQ
ncbi:MULTISPECIES: hypothetical protein [unclassified Rhodococcus]|uniref:hypothetical protein n=1 Tax=Rhodococcus sp. OK519 TaxID=2135729 RepID=UPI001C62E982